MRILAIKFSLQRATKFSTIFSFGECVCSACLLEAISSEKSREKSGGEIGVRNKVLDVRTIKAVLAITQIKVVAIVTAPTQYPPWQQWRIVKS